MACPALLLHPAAVPRAHSAAVPIPIRDLMASPLSALTAPDATAHFVMIWALFQRRP
ncbi:MAG TPA: hypothetical protein VN719_10845 [Gemmatimonadales bacterium]|nr:hypothetical protein [Gemmatimonadales bacterium]